MNASLTYHVPEMSSYKQKASKNVDLSKYDPDKIYMMVYMADYDGTGSLQLHLPRIWETTRAARCLWPGVSPVRRRKIPMPFSITCTRRPRRTTISCPPTRAAPYLNPLNLLPENKDKKYARKVVPDGVDTFMEYVAGLSKKYDLSCDPRLIFTNGMWPDRLLRRLPTSRPPAFPIGTTAMPRSPSRWRIPKESWCRLSRACWVSTTPIRKKRFIKSQELCDLAAYPRRHPGHDL